MDFDCYGGAVTCHWRHVYEGILTFSPSVLLVPIMMFSHYSPGTTEPGDCGLKPLKLWITADAPSSCFFRNTITEINGRLTGVAS